jgi:hypothetical protein
MKTEHDAEKADLDAYVAKIVDGWPPIPDEKLDRIAALLRAGNRYAAKP